jgi:hypothetical protein
MSSHNDDWFEFPTAKTAKKNMFGWSSSTTKEPEPLEGPVPRKLPPPPTIRPTTTTNTQSRPRSRKAGTDNADDMSECTIDTSIRDHYNHHHHHHHHNNLLSPNVHSLIADLKLELANLKSDSDRTCLKMKKMESSLTEKDEQIATLQLENRNLSMELRKLEKVLLMRNMTQTVGVATATTTTPLRDTGCGLSAETTTATPSCTSNQQQQHPYRTQFVTTEEEDEVPFVRREGLSIEFNKDIMKSIRFANDRDHLEEMDEQETMLDVSVHHLQDRHTLKQQQHHQHQQQDSKSVLTKETDTASSSHNNNNHAQVEIYPDDDPFSTLNAEESEDPKDVVKPAGWFRWGSSVQSSK